MRIIAHFHTNEAVYEAQMRLEKAGIPVIVEFDYGILPKKLGRANTLLVALDEQFQEAESALKDPNHVVKNPIDVQAFKRHMSQKLRDGGDMTAILNVVVGAVLGLIVLLFLLLQITR